MNKKRGISFKIAIYAIAQASATLLSRISGLIRDVITANYLGADILSDAFFASFRIPNTIRKLIGEGPLSASFTPIFIQNLITSKQSARIFAGKTLLWIIIVSSTIATILFIYMKPFLATIAPGLLVNQNTFNTAVTLSRISIPFMVMTCIVAVLGGITNGMQSFFTFGITPMILNFSMVGCALFLGNHFPNKAFNLSIGVVLGGTIQIIFMLHRCAKLKITPIVFKGKKTKNINKSLKTLLIRLAPITFGQGIFQINMFVDGIFASFTPKTQSYLYYSDRLSQFAITLIGHTLGMVSLPMISKYIKINQKQKALSVQSKCLLWAIMWSMPAASSLFALAHPIVSLIYQRGQFTELDTYHVGNMLQIASITIPLLSLNRVYYASLYSIDRVKAPVAIGIISVCINLSSNVILMHRIPHYYLVVSSGISSIAECIMLSIALQYKYQFLTFGKQNIYSSILIIPSAIATSCFAKFIHSTLNLSHTNLMIVTVLLSVILYTFLIVSIGVINANDLFAKSKSNIAK